MLTKFSVENFKGFNKKITLDFSNPCKYDFNQDAIKNGIIKNGIIYGKNGTGKSNLGLAIFDIITHLTNKLQQPAFYENYSNANSHKKTTTFCYEFLIQNQKIVYTYEKENQLLISELLTVDNKSIVERTLNTIQNESEFLFDKTQEKQLLDAKNNFSILNFIATSFPLKKNHYLLNLFDFVNNMLWFRSLDQRAYIGYKNVSELIENFIVKSNYLEDFQKFLFEVSEQKFELQSFNSGNQNEIGVKFQNSTVYFKNITSTGTKTLQLLYYWYKQMEHTSFVYIDEFDAFYHFELAKNVCKKLFALDCQVFVSTHNTFLMSNSLLRPDCNFLLYRTETNEVELKPLSESTDKELREAHNIEKIYRGGGFEQ